MLQSSITQMLATKISRVKIWDGDDSSSNTINLPTCSSVLRQAGYMKPGCFFVAIFEKKLSNLI